MIFIIFYFNSTPPNVCAQVLVNQTIPVHYVKKFKSVSRSVVSDSFLLHGVKIPAHEFSRQGYRSGLPFPSPGDLPDPEIETGSPTSQADS